MNPWLNVPLFAYEGHMALDAIYQLQTLNALVKARLDEYRPRTLAIWGLAGGNGLGHIDAGKVDYVLGVDINGDYLSAAAARYPALEGKLKLLKADLTMPLKPDFKRPLELVIADLIIEYIGVEALCSRVLEASPKRVSCVIQLSNKAAFVSASPFESALEGIGRLHQDIDEPALALGLEGIGYAKLYRQEHVLKSGKAFIRLDFEKIAAIY